MNKTIIEKLNEENYENDSVNIQVIDNDNVFIITTIIDENFVRMDKVCHKRLENDKLVIVHEWIHQFKYVYDNFKIKIEKIDETNTCLIRSSWSYHEGYSLKTTNEVAMYDYIEGKFIINTGIFDYIITSLMWGYEREIYKKYNGYFAMFSVSASEIQKCKVNDSPIFDKCSFYQDVNKYIPTETYFAFLNKDGGIRENKLFKTRLPLSEVENGSDFLYALLDLDEIIDLTGYISLNDFKEKKIEELNKQCRNLIECREQTAIEVAKILQLNPKNNTLNN